MRDTDLDGALARFGGSAGPEGSDMFDQAVFARIDALPTRAMPSLRVGVMAAVGALAIGVASATLSPAPASAAPFDGATALAPSTLLSGLLR